MKTQLKEEQAYPFAWFDELIEITLNPAHIELKAITPRELDKLNAQLQDEAISVTYQLNNHTFGLSSKTDIQAVVQQYYWAVLDLHRQALENLAAYAHNPALVNTGKNIVAVLDDLGKRIHRRYHSHLPDHTPKAYNHPSLPVMLFKLLIKMSGDQIGILARAAFQAGLIPAKSLRAAFRLLAPHLSTERKEKLSDESMRSHSGQPENPDIDAVLGHLCKVTKIVQGYYRRR